MKKRQIDRIKQELVCNGRISRNKCLREYITSRLGAYINTLKHEGWQFSTKQENGDYVYTLLNAPKIPKTIVERDEFGNVKRVIEVMA